jgi:hypothetical protein
MLSKTTLEQTVEQEKIELIKPALCEIYRQKLLSLPNIIKQNELELIALSLLTSPYVMASRELEHTVARNDQRISNDRRTRVESLIYNQDIDFRKTFSQEKIEEGYRIRIIKPGYSAIKLARDLATVGNCWISRLDLRCGFKKNTLEKVNWMQRDIDSGGCIMLISEKVDKTRPSHKIYNPVVQTRLYIATTKKSEVIIFIDTVENGNIGCDSINNWSRQGRRKEFIYAVAAAIYVARKYGISKIAAGEIEVNELACLLGFKRYDLFSDKSSNKRNIGIMGNDDVLSRGPYVHTLDGDTRRRVISVNDVMMLSKKELSSKLDSVEDFIEQHPKVIRDKTKLQEVIFYLDCIESINKLSRYKSELINRRIEQMRHQYS